MTVATAWYPTVKATTASSRWSSRWSNVDALTLIVGVVAVVVYALHGFEGPLTRDVGVYAYGAQHTVDGVPPYVSILNRGGPLAHLFPAVAVALGRLVGLSDVFAMRLLFFGFSVLSVCVTYVLMRDIAKSRTAGIVAAAGFLSFQGFIEYATYGPREKTPMVLFLLLVLLGVARRRWWLVGASAALATLLWQPAAAIGAVSILVPLITVRRGSRLRAFRAAVFGGVAVTVPVFAYFVLTGSLDEMIKAVLLINAKYTESTSFLENIKFLWPSLLRGYGASLWIMILGLVGLFGVTIRRLRPSASAAMGDVVVVAGVGGFVAVLWSLYDFNGWPDAFYLLPFAAVGLGASYHDLEARLPTASTRGMACVLWATMAVVMALSFSLGARRVGLVEQQRNVNALLALLPADATFMSVQAPQPLVLARKSSITRHQMFALGLADYIDDEWPGGMDGFARWVAERRPDVIVWQVRLRDPHLDPLLQVVREGYRREGYGYGWAWYVSEETEMQLPAYDEL